MNIQSVTWVVKASKFCNMRCGYCYEWNELSNRTRMEAHTWVGLFKAMGAYHRLLASRSRDSETQIVTRFILHGGEPTALPLPYLEEVMRLKAQTLSDMGMDADAIQNSVQTNLYAPSEEMIDFLALHRFSVGVSYDVQPGVRLSVSGQPTESRVRRNIDKLRERGFPVGGIAVLARHTHEKLIEVYEYFADQGIALRILPLFEGPSERPWGQFALSHDACVAALEKLFVHWLETGVRVSLAPFVDDFETVLRKMLHVEVRPYDRRANGDGVMLVNVDGDLFRILDAYDKHLRMGNVRDQGIDEILESQEYADSLRRDEAHRQKYCSTCMYAGGCNGWPAFANQYTGSYEGHCPITYRIHLFMEAYLRRHGFGESELGDMFVSLLAGREGQLGGKRHPVEELVGR